MRSRIDMKWTFDPTCMTSHGPREDKVWTGGDTYYNLRGNNRNAEIYKKEEKSLQRTYWTGGMTSFPERRGEKFDNLTTDSKANDNIEKRIVSFQLCKNKEPEFAGVEGDPIICSLQPECAHYRSLYMNKDTIVEFIICSQVTNPANELAKSAERKFYNRK